MRSCGMDAGWVDEVIGSRVAGWCMMCGVVREVVTRWEDRALAEMCGWCD
jgi:hypothetical protein